MTNNLPKYYEPPVVETVLGIQFAPLPGFTAAHAGRFWYKYLGEDWPIAVEVPRVHDEFERFGDAQRWSLKEIRLSKGSPSPRTQFISQDDERMVQIQNTRLHYNWRKRERRYPSYESSIGGFEETWGNFVTYCTEAQFENLIPNQWEVTYINHILKGELWSTVSDWNHIVPELFVPASRLEDIAIDGLDAKWRLTIGENLGRLHINLEHIRIGGPEGPEALSLNLTARGPISAEGDTNLRNGLDLGHSAIVRTFTDMTSEFAHKHWKRRK